MSGLWMIGVSGVREAPMPLHSDAAPSLLSHGKLQQSHPHSLPANPDLYYLKTVNKIYMPQIKVTSQ
jgi:hypothetical protein